MLKDVTLPVLNEGAGLTINLRGELDTVHINGRLPPRGELKDDVDDNDYDIKDEDDYETVSQNGLKLLVKRLLELAVQRVGWVPRDVYSFMDRPGDFGMFSTLGSGMDAHEPRRS